MSPFLIIVAVLLAIMTTTTAVLFQREFARKFPPYAADAKELERLQRYYGSKRGD